MIKITISDLIGEPHIITYEIEKDNIFVIDNVCDKLIGRKIRSKYLNSIEYFINHLINLRETGYAVEITRGE